MGYIIIIIIIMTIIIRKKNFLIFFRFRFAIIPSYIERVQYIRYFFWDFSLSLYWFWDSKPIHDIILCNIHTHTHHRHCTQHITLFNETFSCIATLWITHTDYSILFSFFFKVRKKRHCHHTTHTFSSFLFFLKTHTIHTFTILNSYLYFFFFFCTFHFFSEGV